MKRERLYVEFDDLESLYDLSNVLVKELASLHEYDLMEKVLFWSASQFTTSTEMLGELRIILNRVAKVSALNETIMEDVLQCIFKINTVLGLR